MLAVRLLAGLGVGAAAEVEMDHAAVGRGPLVGAHAELAAQGAGELHEEAAAGAAGGDGAAAAAGGGLPRPELPAQPALGGLGTALRGEHPGTAQAQLPQRDAIGVLVAGGLVALLEALVLLAIGQQVVGADVLGLQPLGPRLPGRGEDRVLARQQSGLGDGRGLRTHGTGQHDHPGPAAVAGHGALEDVRDQALPGGLGAEVLTDLSGLGDVLERLAGEVDGGRGDRVELRTRGAGAAGGGGRGRHVRPRSCRRRHAARWRSSGNGRGRGSGRGAVRPRRRRGAG